MHNHMIGQWIYPYIDLFWTYFFEAVWNTDEQHLNSNVIQTRFFRLCRGRP